MMYTLASLPATAINKVAIPSNGCWQWQGGFNYDGYGKFRGRPAHRALYEEIVGPVPADLQLDHLCRNIACVNPAHLEPVTELENKRRRYALYTHCRNGHEYNAETTYRDPKRGTRRCRPCNRAAVARLKARRTGRSAR